MKSTIKFLLIGLLLTIICFTLTGCGNDSMDTNENTNENDNENTNVVALDTPGTYYYEQTDTELTLVFNYNEGDTMKTDYWYFTLENDLVKDLTMKSIFTEKRYADDFISFWEPLGYTILEQDDVTIKWKFKLSKYYDEFHNKTVSDLKDFMKSRYLLGKLQEISI